MAEETQYKMPSLEELRYCRELAISHLGEEEFCRKFVELYGQVILVREGKAYAFGANNHPAVYHVMVSEIWRLTENEEEAKGLISKNPRKPSPNRAGIQAGTAQRF
ncbi:MAG: hypothetical protein OIF57_17430 [Marinobacterium sp.]|nr:hypothetical protein [Marinobacterium sp.]